MINLPSRIDYRDAMILIVALSNIKLNWIAGVKGEDVPEKVLPPPASRANIKIGNIGSWRAHLHAIASSVSPRHLY